PADPPWCARGSRSSSARSSRRISGDTRNTSASPRRSRRSQTFTVPEYQLRRATVEDAPTIARHRVAMFSEMGELPPASAPALEAETRVRVAKDLESGAYVGWFIVHDGIV